MDKRYDLTGIVSPLSLTVDLSSCLADAHHVGGTGACVIGVDVSILNAAGDVMSTQSSSVITASPGGSASAGAVTIAATGNQIAVNDVDACTILANSTTYCWGNNSSGELGNGTIATSLTPVQVSGGYRFLGLAGGFETMCGIAADSTVACWGANIFAEIPGGPRSVATPTPISTSLHFTSVFANAAGYCALSGDGVAYCWGNNIGGRFGGDASTYDANIPPTSAPGTLRFATLAVGYYQVCGLIASGAAYCWGENSAGGVGDGTTTRRGTPVPVSSGLTFTTIASGFENTCALTGAGQAYCWGRNDNGELGDGTTSTRLQPTAVAGGHTFTDIQAPRNSNGEASMCALDVSGTLFCWGNNQFGQLGEGTMHTRLLPTPVAGGQRFTQFAIENQGGCALAGRGKPYCWGLNAFVSLSNEYRLAPTRVKGSLLFASISTGAANATSCGLTTSGTAACWGFGALGTGSLDPQNQPTNVKTSLTFTQVQTAGRASCGLATGGTLYCWGGATFNVGGVPVDTVNAVMPPSAMASGGSLSAMDMSRVTSGRVCGLTQGAGVLCWTFPGNAAPWTATPTTVIGAPPLASLAVGNTVACGLTPLGAGYCWGNNTSGELGNGTTTASPTTPVAVVGGLTFTALSSGNAHVCGLIASGAAYCWGNNTAGQLGIGTATTTPNPRPVPVTGGLLFRTISAGSSHTCAVTISGAVYCWGGGAFGVLGTGNDASVAQPTPVSSTQAFVGVSAGTTHTCAWTSTGAAYCWGLNLSGAVGDGTSGYSLTPTPVSVP